MNSWSYIPRDTDPEFAGVISNVHSSSLPGMPFRSGSHVCNGSVIPLGLVSQIAENIYLYKQVNTSNIIKYILQPSNL
jgi:hypothetical protein